MRFLMIISPIYFSSMPTLKSGGILCSPAIQSHSTSVRASRVSLLPEGQSGNSAAWALSQDRWGNCWPPKPHCPTRPFTPTSRSSLVFSNRFIQVSTLSAVIQWLSFKSSRCGCRILVSLGMRNYYRQIRERCPWVLKGLNEGKNISPALFFTHMKLKQ